MKETWVQPRIMVEGFYPNEYCQSVCFQVACSALSGLPKNYNRQDLWGSYANSSYWEDQGSETHNQSCSHADNNAVRIENGNIVIQEYSKEQKKWLRTEVTFGGIDTNNDQQVGTGDLFAWVTFGGGEDDRRMWLHWGTASAKVENAPLQMS